MDGNTSMLMFLGKHYLQQSEKVTHATAPIVPVSSRQQKATAHTKEQLREVVFDEIDEI